MERKLSYDIKNNRCETMKNFKEINKKIYNGTLEIDIGSSALYRTDYSSNNPHLEKFEKFFPNYSYLKDEFGNYSPSIPGAIITIIVENSIIYHGFFPIDILNKWKNQSNIFLENEDSVLNLNIVVI